MDDAPIGEPRVGVGEFSRARQVPSLPSHVRSNLQPGGASAQRVELEVASPASLGGQDLAQVVADAQGI
eukprot:9762091-Heterocapsa_arctica.AAC.1